MLVSLKVGSATAETWTPPAGWTLITDRSSGNVSVGHIACFYKVAAAGDASASRTFSWTTAGNVAWTCTVYSGTDATTPITSPATPNGGTMSTTTLTVNAVTMTATDSLMYACYAATPSGVTFTTGTMTERADHGTFSFGAADQAIAASGSTGTRTITASASVNPWSTIAFGINGDYSDPIPSYFHGILNTGISGGSQPSCVLPAQATTGRLIVLYFSTLSAGQTITTPSGWNLVASPTGFGLARIYWRIAIAGDAGSTVTITNSTVQQWSITCSVYGGTDTTTPIPETQDTPISMSTTSIVASAVTIDTANSRYVNWVVSTTNAAPFTVASGQTAYINAANAGAGNSSLLSDELRTATGTTGTRTHTSAVAVSSAMVASLEIAPAAGAAPKSLIWPTETPYRRLSRR